MFETLRNVWKIEELRKKVLYTVFMLILYRLLCVVPVPGVDLASVQEGLETFSLLQFMNSITGSNLQMYTIMAMGISPYINASIIMQLLCVAIPKLEELNKQVTQLIYTMNYSLDNAFANFDRQRDELQRYVTAERQALVDQLRESADGVVQRALDAVPGLVGKVLLYVVLALVVLIGGPFALGFWLGGVRERGRRKREKGA